MDCSAPDKFVVYGLFDPRDQQLRYIGKTCQGKRRMSSHLAVSHLKNKTHKNHWIKSLLAVGMQPEYVVLESFATPDGLAEAEMWYISYYKSIGCRLTNMTLGGEGIRGMKRSPEFCAMMSRLHSGKKISDQQKAQMRKANLGSKRPPRSIEYSINASRANGGKPFVDELGNRYESIGHAARSLGISKSPIVGVLKGRFKHTRGHTFKYLEGG